MRGAGGVVVSSLVPGMVDTCPNGWGFDSLSYTVTNDITLQLTQHVNCGNERVESWGRTSVTVWDPGGIM